MVSSKEIAERQPPRKATLYCADCDHANRINGDWLIDVHTDHLDYECPECGATIDSRRNGSDLTTQSGGTLRFGDAD